MLHTSLSLEKVKYHVHLGCSASEREQLQEIQISVKVDFAESPPACRTDRIEDSLSYSDLESALEEVLKNKSFNTIEFLGHSCWQALQKFLKPGDEMSLCIHKIYPPLGKSLEGAFFRIRGKKD